MASNAHSINDVQAEPACVGGTQKHPGVHRAEAPAIESTVRRSRTAA